MRIYMTHCSARKDNALRGTGKKVTPDELYKATPTQRFIRECKEKKVNWAIFSDQYGVWFPDEVREWYEKDPDTVTEDEFKNLLNDFDQKLQGYDEIWFYYNPGRFHRLYDKLLKQAKLRNRVRQFTHIAQIV